MSFLKISAYGESSAIFAISSYTNKLLSYNKSLDTYFYFRNTLSFGFSDLNTIYVNDTNTTDMHDLNSIYKISWGLQGIFN